MVSPYLALAGTGLLACFSQSVRQAFTDSLSRTFDRLSNYLFPTETTPVLLTASKDVLKRLIKFSEEARTSGMDIKELADNVAKRAKENLQKLQDKEKDIEDNTEKTLAHSRKIAEAKKELENAEHMQELVNSLLKLICDSDGTLTQELIELSSSFESTSQLDSKKVKLIRQESDKAVGETSEILKSFFNEYLEALDIKQHISLQIIDIKKNIAALAIQIKAFKIKYGQQSEQYNNAIHSKQAAEEKKKELEEKFKEAQSGVQRALALLIDITKDVECDEHAPSPMRMQRTGVSAPLRQTEEDKEEKADESPTQTHLVAELHPNDTYLGHPMVVELSSPSAAAVASLTGKRASEHSMSVAAGLVGSWAGDDFGLGFGGGNGFFDGQGGGGIY